MSLFKKKSVSETKSQSADAASVPASGSRQKKGPTPPRKVQEAKNYRGIIGGDKKAAKARAREESRRQMELEQEGMRTGREDLLPTMHKGPAKRFVRDFVDSRHTFSEWMMPALLIVMFGGLIIVSLVSQHNKELAIQINTWSMIITYVLLILGIVEGTILARMARNKAVKKLGETKIPRGLRWYAFSRLIMPRRWRQPRPQVTRSWRKS